MLGRPAFAEAASRRQAKRFSAQARTRLILDITAPRGIFYAPSQETKGSIIQTGQGSLGSWTNSTSSTAAFVAIFLHAGISLAK
jgi:hypothetical protein